MRQSALLQGPRLMKFAEDCGWTCRGSPVDEVMQVLELFDTRYRDFTARHFHEKPVAGHGCTRSGNQVRLTLQAHGSKRERRALPARGEWTLGASATGTPARWHGRGQPIETPNREGRVTRFDATGRAPVDKGTETTTEAVDLSGT